MCDTIAVKREAFPIKINDCKMLIKKETNLESYLEGTPTKIKSELKDDLATDVGMGNELHCVPTEFITCNSYHSDNKTDAKIDIKEHEWLETTFKSEPPDIQFENKLQDTLNGKEEESSLVQSLRRRTKSTLRGSWSGESMKEALDQVVAGKIGLRKAAKRYGVPRSSLYDRIKQIRNGVHVNILPKLGRFKPTFMGMEEKLIQHLQELRDCLMPLTRKEFLKLAYDLAEKLKINHRFSKDKKTAGNHFYSGFMERHPELPVWLLESASHTQPMGCTKQQIEHFYNKLEGLMSSHKFSASHIYNMSEAVVSCTNSNVQVLTTKGKQQVGKLTSAEKAKHVTVAFAMNPVGDFIPPYFIFPRKKLNARLMWGAPEKSVGCVRENGCMNGETFLQWLKHFLKHVEPENNPVLLILEGSSSHKELQVIMFAQEHNIHMLSLPPNTSDKLEPFNCTFMKPFESSVAVWVKENAGRRISEADVARIVSAAFSKVSNPDIAKNGFHFTGIYPFNPHTLSHLDFPECHDTTVNKPQVPVPCLASGVTVLGLKQCDQIGNQDSPRDTHNTEQMEINIVSGGLHKLSPLPPKSKKRQILRKKSQKTDSPTSIPYKRQCDQIKNQSSPTDTLSMEIANSVSDGLCKLSSLPDISERRLLSRNKSQKSKELSSITYKQQCCQIRNQNSPRIAYNVEQMEIANSVSDDLCKLSSLPDISERRPISEKKSQKTEGLTSSPYKQQCDQIKNQNSQTYTQSMKQMETTNYVSNGRYRFSSLRKLLLRNKSQKTKDVTSKPKKQQKGSFIFKSIYSSN